MSGLIVDPAMEFAPDVQVDDRMCDLIEEGVVPGTASIFALCYLTTLSEHTDHTERDTTDRSPKKL